MAGVFRVCQIQLETSDFLCTNYSFFITWILVILAKYLFFYLKFLTIMQAVSLVKLQWLDARSDNLKFADWLRGKETFLRRWQFRNTEADNSVIQKLTIPQYRSWQFRNIEADNSAIQKLTIPQYRRWQFRNTEGDNSAIQKLTIPQYRRWQFRNTEARYTLCNPTFRHRLYNIPPH